MGFCIQLRLLLWKNWLIKKRQPLGTLFEIFFPAIILILLVLIRSALQIEDKEIERCVYTTSKTTPSTRSLLKPVPILSSNVPFQVFSEYWSPNIAISPDPLKMQPGESKIMMDFIAYLNDSLLATFKDSSTRRFKFPTFETEAQMEDYVRNNDDYGKNYDGFLWGVVFNSIGTSSNNYQWSYSIRSNSSDLPQTQNQDKDTNPYTLDYEDSYDKYIENQVIYLQALIEQFIIENSNPNITVVHDAMSCPMPIPAHQSDPFSTKLNSVIPLFYLISFLYPCAKIVRNIVEEKETRIKEGMRMMGLLDSAFWLSWYITYTIMFFITALAIIIIGGSSVYKYSDKGIIFFYFWIFGVSMISFGTFLSCFFSKAKIAGTFSYVLIIGAYVPMFVLGSLSDQYSHSQKTASGLLPPTAFGLGSNHIHLFESYQLGMNPSTAGSLIYNYTFNTTIGMLIADTVLYWIFTWYFDKVIPSDWGVALPPWFFLLPSYWCGRELEEEEQPLKDETAETVKLDTIESVSDDIKKQPVGVSIQNLRKVYSDGNVAVNKLSLDMYMGQIFCLLGHNGAGKTTTISMLTGMLPVSSGDALIEGMSIKNNMRQIREKIGVCPQHDILFPTLTVSEHLQLYAALKGIPKNEIMAQVNKKIAEIGLTEKVNTYSMALSGGMKRKLSVAIAFIGGSKVIFLDEPTSGVDAYSRRSTWDMLNKNKEGKVIVLTTHFMDEADILGDRIAIMAAGTIQCCGTSLFLKSLYGVGYSLVLTREVDEKNPEKDEKHDPLVDLIKTHVPNADKLSNVGSEVAYRLPLQASQYFPVLFQELDENKKKYKVVNYGVSVTTLEEVFLKVGKMEEPNKAKKDELIRSQSLKRQASASHNDDDDKETVAMRVEAELSKSSWEVFRRHFTALFTKRFHYAKRDFKAVFFQLAIPLAFLIVGFGILQIPTNFQFPKITLNTNNYNSPNYIPVNTMESFAKSVQDSRNQIELFRNNSAIDFETALLERRNEYEQSRYGAFFFNTTGLESAYKAKFESLLFVNRSAFNSLPIYLNMLNNMFLKNTTKNNASSISGLIQAFPFTRKQQQLISTLNGFFSSLITVLAYSFIPASYAVFVVREREIKAKHLQVISGVGPVSYWFSTYAWDLCNYLIPFIGSIIVIAGFNNKSFVGENWGVTILNFILYGYSVAPFTYMVSFMFKSHSNAQTVLVLVYVVTGLLFIIASFSLDAIGGSVKDINSHLKFIYRLFPPFCLGQTLMNLASRDFVIPGEAKKGPWDFEVCGYNFIFMAVFGTAYLALTLLLEHLTTMPEFMSMIFRPPHVVDEDEKDDEDVIAERMRIQDGLGKDDAIRIEGLRKVYSAIGGGKPKVAVKNLYYGIAPGECFGFLGINGAGKTTTLSILSGEFPPSSGRAYLMNNDVVTQQDKCRRLIGYCPQFDALLELLTAKEHLELFARIKGVPESKLENMVNSMLKKLTLTPYKNRPAGAYSGGNKRKLSTAIALIGNPPIVFLDEPSTGMDPVSRRFMWDFISSTMKGRSVILTTHSMEECEALCHRLGIMVGGRLRCLGTPQHIKHRFGQGYQVDLNIVDDPVYSKQIDTFMKQNFPDCMLTEEHGTRFKYQISAKQTLGAVFSLIEKHKNQLGIKEYSVGQTSLEQVFIDFAKQQKEEKGTVEGIMGYNQPQKDNDIPLDVLSGFDK